MNALKIEGHNIVPFPSRKETSLDEGGVKTLSEFAAATVISGCYSTIFVVLPLCLAWLFVQIVP
jgi:hypothetical protein